MKRSEINEILSESIEFCREMNFNLPPWGHWSPEQWAQASAEYDEIRDNKLGWDITDYGGRDPMDTSVPKAFSDLGLVLFTIRNGNPDPNAGYIKSYCEKLLLVGESQQTPYHYHANKMEDIICRAGGNLLCVVYNRADDDSLDTESPVHVSVDGRNYEVAAGETVRLKPGESIALPSFQYHEFYAEEGTGMSLVGEVSKVNDDANDNFFLGDVGRFPEIEADEPPLRYLCTEYPATT